MEATTRYHLVLEYDGTRFCGWQAQKNALSVQEVLEEAIFLYSRARVRITAAGRTDTGVHALAQHIHFDLPNQPAAQEVRDALNYYLRTLQAPDITITQAEIATPDFHARFDAVRRHYLYRLLLSPTAPALNRNRVLWVRHPLDLDSMQQAATCLIGKHDFSAFRAASCQARTPIRTMETIAFAESSSEPHGQGKELCLRFSADGFLQNQIRIIVGSLVMIGLGRWQAERMAEILHSKHRPQAGPTAAACGLYFAGADYPAPART